MSHQHHHHHHHQQEPSPLFPMLIWLRLLCPRLSGHGHCLRRHPSPIQTQCLRPLVFSFSFGKICTSTIHFSQPVRAAFTIGFVSRWPSWQRLPTNKEKLICQGHCVYILPPFYSNPSFASFKLCPWQISGSLGYERRGNASNYLF